ncbi:polysaccharide biosynthesis/export family protein [Flavobacterium sp. GT3R68]|uniref:polysaccharide biosynthesis/export family protein n=1 Tax=Flavobacterium sp. GT3R68 TaxID=2594437 RepID=UPI000F899530|nr:polysaccharide biosynthesis/export family protein [Flavobacterium sp. GT3R68]RTY92284.1 sugar transporter [Flavobacterium sp. GSN2]TRW92520.1 sugar transporter [Flavobacterium sp. GT3R68]
MNRITIYFLLLVGFSFTSCIPTKDLIYLQNKDDSTGDQSINQVMSKPYRMQTNDIIIITINATDPKLVAMFNTGANGQTESGAYFEGYSVDDHGNIRLPVLGELNVLGFTADEIRTKVEALLLSDYFNKEANIFVNVKLAGFRYTINGEVSSPGSKILYRDKVNIMEAIANSGDIAITGNRKEIVIIRQFPQGTEMHTIDLTDVNVMKSPYYNLQPNDFIYIKPLKQKTWGTGTTGIQSFTTIVSGLTLIISTYLVFKSL